MIKRYIAAIMIVLPLIAATQPSVVVSIKPVNDIVAAVMQDVAEPTLLLPPGASPHSYAMKPSQMQALSKAGLVIWVGPELENFLERPLKQIPPEKIFTLLNTEQLILYPYSGHDAHNHGEMDPHFWLDPLNMKIVADMVAERLSMLDPDNAQTYLANASAVKGELTQLNQQLMDQLKPVQDKPFIVFHDAYQYFEKRYHLTSAGSLTINPDIMPSAAQIVLIKQTINERGVTCILSEPQFSPAIVQRISQESGVNYGTIDPVNGPNGSGFTAYAALMQQLADALSQCLTGDKQ